MNLETNMAAIGKRYNAAFDYEVSDDEVASRMLVICFELSKRRRVSCSILCFIRPLQFGPLRRMLRTTRVFYLKLVDLLHHIF